LAPRELDPSADHGFSIASAIFNRLPDNPQSHRIIADPVIERMSFAPEHSSFLSRDYASDDYFVALLKSALDKRQPGSLSLL
jgi:hypothetical protein